MKKWMAIGLALMLLWGGASAQDAQSVGRAAPWFDPQTLRALPGYQMDESGQWRCGAVKAEAQLDALSRTGLSRACLMQLVYTGSADTGLILPALQLDVVGETLDCQAISLLVGGTRYDLPVFSERVKLGERQVDRLTAPLTREGMALVDALKGADQAQLRLHGKKTYTTTIEMHYDGADAKKKLEAQARWLLEVPGAPDMARYALWDLSHGAWEAEHGFAPRMDQAPYEGKLEAMVSPGASGSRVRDVERALIDAGLMSGAADGEYTTRTRDAILRAQQLYDLVPTGSGDRRLIDLLAGGLPGPKAPDRAPEPAFELTGARIDFARWWTAQAASPSKAPHGEGRYGARNQDDRLLIVEGVLENRGDAPLRPDWQLTGHAELSGASYPLRFLGEKDGGSRFGGEVLPLGRTRILAVAQIPPAADGPGLLTVTLGGQSLTFVLDAAAPAKKP